MPCLPPALFKSSRHDYYVLRVACCVLGTPTQYAIRSTDEGIPALAYVSIQPPSTLRLTPVTARFSSRNTVASTTSSIVTSSPSGVRLRYLSSTSWGLPAQ